MAKVKLTKGELKKQRDALKRFAQYLPILQLKKQQLQMEIQRVQTRLSDTQKDIRDLKEGIRTWSGVLNEPGDHLSRWIRPKEVVASELNIAGVDIPVFERVVFEEAEYDLYATPLWTDVALEKIRALVTFLETEKILKSQLEILGAELRVTTQRVNLFEKVKIPECRENIRVIRIYMGDQQANAVGRSKIAKRKIEALVMAGAAA